MSAGTADLTALVKTFADAKKKAPDMADKVLSDASEKIKGRMQELAPKKTGKLYMSIRVVSEPGRYVIGPVGVEYAVYQEFGTGTRGELGGSSYVIKPRMANQLSFRVNGKWVTTKMVVHPGIPAHPYARPALAEYVHNIADDMAREAAELTLAGARAN